MTSAGVTVAGAAAWGAAAPQLAEHAMRQFVNRVDVWGSYLTIERRVPNREGIVLTALTAPAKRNRGAVLLTPALLERHFVGADKGHLIGTHTTSVESTSKYLAFDIDCHEPDVADRSAENLALAARIVAVLRDAGAEPTMEDSNGAGGVHVWVPFDCRRGIPRTRQVYGFAQQVLAAVLAELPPALAQHFVRPGADGEPDRLAIETYPKQPDVGAGTGAAGGFGNWLRLPGAHHTRDHWSRIAEGGRWLAGEAAVERWLAAPLTPLSVLPDLPDPPPPPRVRRLPMSSVFGLGPAMERRIGAYRARLPVGMGAGQGRSDVAFQFALFLVNACGLDEDAAVQELAVWNAGNASPLGAGKLRDTVRNAGRYNTRYQGATRAQPAPFVGLRGRPPVRWSA